MESEGTPIDVRERFQQLYEQLRDVADGILRHPAHSITPGDLVHDAFLELQREEQRRLAHDRSQLGPKPDSVFKACFGAACRDVLADRYRRKNAQKRGGGVEHEPMRSTIPFGGDGPADVQAVHDALSGLAEHDELVAQIVQARLFGGMSVSECADVYQVSASTVDRHWRFGKAWLRERLM